MNICEILKDAKHICVVGISDKPGRDSGRIALMLKNEGYHVTGVHPALKEFAGIKYTRHFKMSPAILILWMFL